MKKIDYFISDDGAKIAFYCWLPEEEPIAVVQIAHGMMEYAERYEDFAKFLNKNRIVVYANDHRGHGKTAGSIENLGHLADDNGWIKVVADLRMMTKIIRQDYPKLPVILFGHSAGSFLARTYITLYDDINGVIISGTAAYPKYVIFAGRLLAFFQGLFKDKRSFSPFFDNMSFNSFRKHFNESKSAWLCRDQDVVKQYENDPYCGFVCTLGYYKDMFYGLNYISQKTHNQWIRFTLPVYIVSGSEDCLGEFGKGPQRLGQMYRKRQLEEVTVNIFEGARHEILNETNKQEVYEDLLEWITYHI
ncbi:MAG: alpha/beta hydrolase [Candidatus Marinimicrobia bacterium]|nr:alpha/beta hydrolase [Candidatus Neomarinimicrobiota bacterium]